jgi:hypothetical protein
VVRLASSLLVLLSPLGFSSYYLMIPLSFHFAEPHLLRLLHLFPPISFLGYVLANPNQPIILYLRDLYQQPGINFHLPDPETRNIAREEQILVERGDLWDKGSCPTRTTMRCESTKTRLRTSWVRCKGGLKYVLLEYYTIIVEKRLVGF